MHTATPQTTKAFRNGNSLAVRIPAALAYDDTDVELEIERIGDELRIRPARRPLTDALAVFARFSSDFMKNGRGTHAQKERAVL